MLDGACEPTARPSTWAPPGSGPRTQPAITRLVADLGLASFEQHDDGRVLHLFDPNRAPQTRGADRAAACRPPTPSVPATARCGARRRAARGRRHRRGHRRAGPAAADRAAAPGPAASKRVVDHGDFIELRLRYGAALYSVNARRVVLALPPRVADAGAAVSAPSWRPMCAPRCAPRPPGWPPPPRPAWPTRAPSGARPATAATPGSPMPRRCWPRSSTPAAGRERRRTRRLLALGRRAARELRPRPRAAARTARSRSSSAPRPPTRPCGRIVLAGLGHRAARPAARPTSPKRACRPPATRPTATRCWPQAHWQGRLYFGGSETARQGGRLPRRRARRRRPAAPAVAGRQPRGPAPATGRQRAPAGPGMKALRSRPALPASANCAVRGTKVHP